MMILDIACVSLVLALWCGYHLGYRAKRPTEPAEPGTGVGRSTTAGDVLRGTAGQPERGARPPGDDARPPPWRVEAGGDQSPVLGLSRDRSSYAADHPVRSIQNSN
jgi:hypothetical protein